MVPAATGSSEPPRLPGEAELRAFAETAALLLTERRPRASGTPAATRRPGVGLHHLDHRDYQSGDELRHIDWRQTARARRPIAQYTTIGLEVDFDSSPTRFLSCDSGM